MKALILAGGLGIRLRSVVPDRPKCMADVGGKPFLEWQLGWLRAYGFREVVLCVGYLARQIQDYFGDGRRWGMEIAYAVEKELLGTAGAIRNARAFINGSFLALNGDSYLEADLLRLIEFHRRQVVSDVYALGTIVAVRRADASAYGSLQMNGDGRVVRFLEKVETGPAWVNGGIYALEPAILDYIPQGRPVSLEKEILPQILEAGRHLYGYPTNGFFVDIGTPQGYKRFLQRVGAKAAAKSTPPGSPD